MRNIIVPSKPCSPTLSLSSCIPTTILYAFLASHIPAYMLHTQHRVPKYPNNIYWSIHIKKHPTARQVKLNMKEFLLYCNEKPIQRYIPHQQTTQLHI